MKMTVRIQHDKSARIMLVEPHLAEIWVRYLIDELHEEMRNKAPGKYLITVGMLNCQVEPME